MKIRNLILYCFTTCFSVGALYGESKTPTFAQAMVKGKGAPKAADFYSQGDWKILQDSYSAWQKKASEVQKEQLIPKKIHFIWLGSPLPNSCQDIVDSWRQFHPGWEIKVWTDSDLADFHLKNQASFDKAKEPSQKSDIWRYEILERFGGIYADIDFECFQPFDSLCKEVSFFAGIYVENRLEINNAIIGSAPHHPIIALCMNRLEIVDGDSSYDRILEETGSIYLTKCYLQLALSHIGDAVIFPCGYFYPLPISLQNLKGRRSQLIQQWKKPETMAIHYG